MEYKPENSTSLIWKKLKKGDYTVRPFEVYKRWELSTDNLSKNYYENFGIKVYRALYPENHKYFGNVTNISSSLYHRVFTTQSVDPKLLWYYLDHNFFTEYKKEKNPTILTEFDRITYLAESSSVFVLPQGVFGEGIRRGTFSFGNISQTSNLNYSVVDDGKGNLKDSSFDETKFVNQEYLALYLGFNEKYREYNLRNKPTDYVLDMSPYNNNVKMVSPKNISYTSGIPTTDTSQSSGVAALLNGGYFEVENKDSFNFSSGKQFAFSFWINVPVSQSNETSTSNSLFNKNTIKSVDVKDLNTKVSSTTEQTMYSPQYPFDISITNRLSPTPYSVKFAQSSGNQTVEITSSALSTGSWHHVVCQRSASYYQIWVDGTLNSSINTTISNNTTNDNNFYIGGNGLVPFSGLLDEIRVYTKGLNSTEISYLEDNSFANGYAYQTARVGNVFYKSGIAVVSDPRPKYANAFLGRTGSYDYSGLTNGFSGSFRSTTTFYEHEITSKIRKSEYNFTQNPSVYLDKDPNATRVEDYVTSSLFNPYITTIGLYNDNYDLVAIAKLSSPLAKRDDVDLNIIIRFDV